MRSTGLAANHHDADLTPLHRQGLVPCLFAGAALTRTNPYWGAWSLRDPPVVFKLARPLCSTLLKRCPPYLERPSSTTFAIASLRLRSEQRCSERALCRFHPMPLMPRDKRITDDSQQLGLFPVYITFLA